ncbi:recombinase family protein [Nocardia wallacei]|uniref:recombinase family protein n=1 Tax=Nocardia wallacei TaxID=480035 RepID=UPI003CC7E37E
MTRPKSSISNAQDAGDLFTPAALFLSTAARSRADIAIGGEPIAIQVQREAGLRIASQHNLGIVKEFVEIGAPATSLRRRPTLRRMLAYLERHPDVRSAIFPGPHRFSRNVTTAEQLRNRFQQLGVEVILATGNHHSQLASLTTGGATA